MTKSQFKIIFFGKFGLKNGMAHSLMYVWCKLIKKSQAFLNQEKESLLNFKP